MLKLVWQDRIPETEVLERTGILSIHAMLRQVQLRWSGHPCDPTSIHYPAVEHTVDVVERNDRAVSEADLFGIYRTRIFHIR
ncbi:unnamed protein product [Schistocephalus solidus]|uniref:DUF433 domain-containing protein n=1 Tax=Schistocephalus solidus TaxID=70667 RepID=A0A183TDG3_SCHSO|nr:unnamed protein product [Schistocephalus solidus]